MKIRFLATFFIAIIAVVGCKNTSEKDSQNKEIETEQYNKESDQKDEIKRVPDAAHTSRNSLDWNGDYHGTVPCADCPGIETTLKLNQDLTYKIKMVYLDRDGAVEEEGKFEWNDDGQKITLHPAEEGSATLSFFVGENMLYQLDKRGNRITGDIADEYRLEKY